MKKLFLITLFQFALFSAQAQYWQRTNASVAVSGSDARLLTAHTGDTIFALGNTTSTKNVLSVSTDAGQNWSNGNPIFQNLIDGQLATVSQIACNGARLYAQVNLSSSLYNNLYYYSDDLGATWTIDTAGLDPAFNPTYKAAYRMKVLSGGYLVAFSDFYGAFFKHINDNSWTQHLTYSSWNQKGNLDFTYVGNTWYALNLGAANMTDRITKSSDQGLSWTPISISGLPSGFVPSKMVSNHQSKFYMSGTIAGTNANTIMYSNDAGQTWQMTNSDSLANYPNASVYLNDLYAVEDYVFATFFPTSGDTVSRILYSHKPNPDFENCSTDGLSIYPANQFSLGPPALNYFHIGNKLFIAYADDIYSSSPGFTGTNQGITLSENQVSKSLEIYPNPAKDALCFESSEKGEWAIYTLNGMLIESGQHKAGKNSISLKIAPGLYIFKAGAAQSKLIIR